MWNYKIAMATVIDEDVLYRSTAILEIFIEDTIDNL